MRLISAFFFSFLAGSSASGMLVKGNRLRDFEDAPAKPSEGHWKKADHQSPFGKHEAPPSDKEEGWLTDEAEREEIQQSQQVIAEESADGKVQVQYEKRHLTEAEREEIQRSKQVVAEESVDGKVQVHYRA